MSKWANEKLKTSVLEGPSDQIQSFRQLFCSGNKNIAKITHFNINTGLKFPKLGRNWQCPCNFPKIFKGPLLHCQKCCSCKIFRTFSESLSSVSNRVFKIAKTNLAKCKYRISSRGVLIWNNFLSDYEKQIEFSWSLTTEVLFARF